MATLPLDLIREIIELFVEGRLGRAASLATISRDFNECVRPILSRTLMYYHTTLERQWPVSKVYLPHWLDSNGKYVRNLMWGDSYRVEDLPNIFRYCPNLTNLVVWVNTSEGDLSTLLPSLSTLHLSRLSVNLYELFGKRHFSEQKGLHDAFKTITHLDVIHGFTQWEEIEGIASMPCLTHLSFSSSMLDMEYQELISRVLGECKHLKVLAFVSGNNFPKGSQFRAMLTSYKLFEGEFNDEPRMMAFECEYIADWVYGATGREDMWVLADQTVAQRLKLLEDGRIGGDIPAEE